MLSIIEKLKAENDQLYLKLSDYELLTNKNLTFKIRLGEIEKLRDENAKLKQKLIKFDELNVRSASLNSTNSIIDDLKRQLQDYPRLINEINILTDKIRQLEAIIEKDNHIKSKIKDFEEIYNQNIQFKYQLKEFTKFGLDNKILIEQNLIVNDKNNELTLEINKLKIKYAKLYDENLLLVKNNILEENYEINKLKKQISSLETQTDELIILKEAMIKLIEERDRNNIEIPILKEKLSVLDRDLNLHMKKFESWKGIYLDMISINDLEIKAVNDNNIRFKLIISQKKNEEISLTYKICDLGSGVIYSIFLMERKFHLLNEPKVEKDYELFSEYFMKIHYYGTIRLGENEFNYIITNAYNNCKLIPNLTNDQKYKFLINNLSFLDKLQKNNMIHTDYNIENIGYDDEMNIVMTNYDLQTILKIEEGSYILKRRNILKFRIELVLRFINDQTIIPNYVEKNNISLEQLDKFSCRGLKDLICKINFKYIKLIDNLPLPLSDLGIVSRRHIGKISSNSITDDLNLDNISYDIIPEYAEIREVFEWLHRNKYISCF